MTGGMFGDVKGRLFDTWARSPFVVANDYVDSPVYIIESIFRDVLGITAINTASYDAVGGLAGTRPYDQWKFARSIIEPTSSIDTVNQICFESGMVSTRDYQNKECLKPIDFVTPTISLTTADVVLQDRKPLIRARQTHVKNVRNEFYLNYKFNYGSGSYDKQLFITASSSNLAVAARSNTDGSGATYSALCSTSQTLYNKVQRWEYNADWIRADSVAELFIKFMANWLAIRRWELDATLWYNANSLALELMDTVFWSHTLLPSSVRNVNPFFVTRISDGGLADRFKFQMHFELCPTVLGTSGTGYGFHYGETGYGSAQL